MIQLGFGSYEVGTTFTENPETSSVYSGPSPASQLVNVGSPIQLSVVAKGWNNAYQWRKNGLPIAGATARTYSSPPATLADDGAQYDVVLSNRLNSANVVTSTVATVSVRTPVELTWYPTVDGVTWSTSVANWTKDQGASQSPFTTGDNATFNYLGHGLGSLVLLTNAVVANAVSVNLNSFAAYQFNGDGSLSAEMLRLTGDGTGTLGLQAATKFNNATIETGSTLNIGNSMFTVTRIVNDGTVNFSSPSGILTIDGNLSGKGLFNQAGAGNVVLTATDSQFRVGSISAGSGYLSVACAPLGNFVNDAQLVVNGPADISFTNTISGNGGMAFRGGQHTYMLGESSYTGQNNIMFGPVTVNNPLALGDYNQATTLIRGNDAFGGLFLSNNITWLQDVTIQAKSITTGAAGVPSLGNQGGSNTVAGSLSFSSSGGTEFNIDSSAGVLAIDTQVINNAHGTNSLNLQGTAVGRWLGVLTDGPNPGVDTLSILKRGSGTWSLEGVNANTGMTTVQQGTLLVNGQTGPGGMSVLAGGTLGGTGVINGELAVANGGVLSPGVGIGTLIVSGSPVLNGTVEIEVSGNSGTHSDQLAVNGPLVYAGTLKIVNVGASPLQPGQTFTAFTASNISGSFATVTTVSAGQSITWNINSPLPGQITVASVGPVEPPKVTTHFSDGMIDMSWTSEYLGWVLMEQTNKLSSGVSTNPADWGIVPGSMNTNRIVIPVDQGKPAEFFRLVSP